MPPYISVCVPTMRVGGLDILFTGLKQQTYTNFELVLSDGLKKYRAGIVETAAREYGLAVTHVEPDPNPFPLSAFCAYANAALLHARGEVVVFLVDYTLAPENLLATHAAFHRAYADECALMCPHDYLELPRVPFNRYSPEEIVRYVGELTDGTLSRYLWSVGWSDLPLPPDPVYKGADPKLKLPPGPIDPTYFHAKNESVKLKHLMAVNGWDEEYDGAHPYQDCDLAERLTRQAGVQWRLDPSCVAKIINPRPYFPFPRRIRTVEANHAMWESKRRAGYPRANPGWELSKRREEWLRHSSD